MCESKVVILKGGKKETIMEDVIRIDVEKDYLRIYGLLGEYKELKGRVRKMDLRNHEIVVEGDV